VNDGTAGPGEAHPAQARQKAPNARREKDFLNTTAPHPEPETLTFRGIESWQEKDNTNLIRGNDR
jgi:hypothetical protein